MYVCVCVRARARIRMHAYTEGKLFVSILSFAPTFFIIRCILNKMDQKFNAPQLYKGRMEVTLHALDSERHEW